MSATRSPANSPSPYAGERTRHFTNVLGVFQGGGVRGAALAGAYAAAIGRGVRFSAVAGTSAGSIVAALIAAGARPEFLRETLVNTAFAELLTPPTPAGRAFRAPLSMRLLKSVRPVLARGMDAELVQALVHSGAYSADGVQRWVSGLLQDLTGIQREVLFSDLRIPLYVVAADLRRRSVKVWSPSTPDVPVAWAVRCSSSIPFFFQPYVDGENLYVDGGTLSNLPSFVYALPDAARDIQNSITRVLAFRLMGDRAAEAHGPATLRDFFEALVDTQIEGAIDLQLKLQADVHTVVIPTGAVKATDFRTITEAQRLELYQNGERKTLEFLNEERQHVTGAVRRQYRGFEEQMYLLTSLARERFRRLTVVSPNSSFLYYTIPLLLFAAEDGLEVRVVLPALSGPLAASGHAEESYRRRLLQGLGAQIVEVEEVPWDGFIFSSGPQQRRGVLASLRTGAEPESQFTERPVAFYTDPGDDGALDALERDVERITSGVLAPAKGWIAASGASVRFRWETCPEGEVFEMLKGIHAYHECTMTMEPVPLAEVMAVDRFIKEYRIPSVDRLIRGFRAAGRSLFTPVYAAFPDGTRTLITPPVFEYLNGKFVVIEGVTRCFLLVEAGETTVWGVVVRGVSTPLPGTIRPLERVRTTSRTMTLDDNFERYERAYLRPVERVTHPF